MSWISKLAETYDNSSQHVMKAESEKDLLPVGHTTQNAQIEISLDAKGNFCSAKVLDKTRDKDGNSEATTVIPCTEDSANRTSGLEPHPLFDKLQYVAGDFAEYDTGKKSGFDLYIGNLQKWCESEYANPVVKVIYTYLQKKSVISDLILEKILFTDEPGKVILEKWNGDEKETPPIFKLTTKPADAFIRFRVDGFGTEQRVWMDESVRKDFIAYYSSTFSDKEVCYVNGEELPISRKNSAKIRNTGDKAKLISSNDMDGFTFRGRFTKSEQAMCLSYDVSQKSVNALKWLIANQGYHNGDQAIVAWGTQNEKLPPITDDTFEFLSSTTPDDEKIIDTRREFADRMNKAIAGYSVNLNDTSEVVVMAVDSATPGRLSIVYYRELTGSEFLNRVTKWYSTSSWYPLFHGENDENGKLKWYRFYGSPSPLDIAQAAYGKELNDKLKKAAIERLLPCIIDGKSLPLDIVQSVSRRASRPVSMDKWEYNKTLGVSCAVIRKYLNDRKNDQKSSDEYKEVWTVELNPTEDDRSYLFGRILAYARKVEEYSLYKSGQDPRQTNAERMMERFRQHPADTWDQLYRKLLPYMSKFRNFGPEFIGNRYEAQMNSVIKMLKDVPNGFTNESLSPVYLLGYQSQLNQFEKEYQENKAKKAEKEKSKGVQ